MTDTAQIVDKKVDKTRSVSILRAVAYSLIGLVIVLAGLAGAVVLFPPGWLAKDFIAAAVNNKTGRTLSVAGASKLTLRPNIRLRLEKVSLSGLNGGADPAPFTSDSVEVEVTIINLWERRFEVPHIILKQPAMTLTAGDPLLTDVAEGNVGAGGIPQLITVTDGSLTIVPTAPQSTMSVEAINGRFSRTANGKGLAFKGSVIAVGETVAVASTVGDLAELAGGQGSPIAVSVKTDMFQASVNGDIATVPIGQITGQMVAKTAQLPKLLKMIDVDPRRSNLGKNAAIKGQISGSLRRLSLNPGTITLDAVKGGVAGELSIDEARPSIDATLTTDKLDIDAILPRASRPAAFATGPLDPALKLPTAWESLLRDLKRSTGHRRGVRLAAVVPNEWWSGEPFALKRLPDVDVALAINAKELTYAELPLKNARLVVHSNPAQLKVLLKSLELYSGSLSGRVDLDLSDPPLSTGFQLKFRKMQLGPFVSEVLNQKLFNGVGNVDVTVAGKGGTMRELIGSLDGSTILNVRKGEIVGFDLRRAILSFGQGQSYNPQRRTRFDRLKGSFSLRNGVLRNTEEFSLTGPQVDLSSTGSIGLVTGRLDQRLNLSLKPPPWHLPIPLRLRGTVKKPRINWGIFSAIAEPNKFATPFAIGLESELMPDHVRTKIEKILADETARSRLSPAAREFLDTLLKTR